MSRKKKLIHRGIWYKTRAHNKDEVGRRERTFARAWQKENKTLQHFMFIECSTLEALLVENDRLIPVSQETAIAVATVVQWLGSPVGFSFLIETLEKAGYRVARIEGHKF